jgi:hypothetical protein
MDPVLLVELERPEQESLVGGDEIDEDEAPVSVGLVARRCPRRILATGPAGKDSAARWALSSPRGR